MSAGQAIIERHSVINELRDSVVQSAQHVRHLQQQLTKTTNAVLDTGGEQHQVSDQSLFVLRIFNTPLYHHHQVKAIALEANTAVWNCDLKLSQNKPFQVAAKCIFLYHVNEGSFLLFPLSMLRL